MYICAYMCNNNQKVINLRIGGQEGTGEGVPLKGWREENEVILFYKNILKGLERWFSC